jgi:UDP-N-acetylglucosamine 2-epimerase
MLITVVGNRPQFIKMAPVSRELAQRGQHEYIVHTGQHFDANMSDVFFEELGIPAPDRNLSIKGRSHGAMTGEMLAALEALFLEEKPAAVLVYGDTNSTLAAALAAVKLHIPIAHAEAGPRMYDLTMPEEVNRVMVDHISHQLFCPDELSVQLLEKENVTKGVHLVGDLMLDSFMMFTPKALASRPLVEELGLGDRPFAFMTSHRPKNTDSRDALLGLLELLRRSPLPVLFAVHPRTEAALKREGLWDDAKSIGNCHMVPALGYLDVLAVLNKATIVLTDSGGLQKEAYFAKKPVLFMYDGTPWPTLEECGWLRCVGSCGSFDVQAVVELVAEYRPDLPTPPLFGDGEAARRIVDVLIAENLV